MSQACEYSESYWKTREAIEGKVTDLPYAARARFQGNLDWLCPKCGHLQTHKIQKGTWKIRCKGPRCTKTFAIAIRFGDLRNRSIPHPPIDYIFPDTDIFDVGNGKRVHTVSAEAVETQEVSEAIEFSHQACGITLGLGSAMFDTVSEQGKSTSSFPPDSGECDR